MLLMAILVALQLLHYCHSAPTDTTGLLSSCPDLLVKRDLKTTASHEGLSNYLVEGGGDISVAAGMLTFFFFVFLFYVSTHIGRPFVAPSSRIGSLDNFSL